LAGDLSFFSPPSAARIKLSFNTLRKMGYQLFFSRSTTHINDSPRGQRAKRMCLKGEFNFVRVLLGVNLPCCFLTMLLEGLFAGDEKQGCLDLLAEEEAEGSSPGHFAQAICSGRSAPVPAWGCILPYSVCRRSRRRWCV
jgi:hypothetical protein